MQKIKNIQIILHRNKDDHLCFARGRREKEFFFFFKTGGVEAAIRRRRFYCHLGDFDEVSFPPWNV